MKIYTKRLNKIKIMEDLMKKFLVVGSSYLNYSYTITEKDAKELDVKKQSECIISKKLLDILKKEFEAKISGGGRGANQALALKRANPNNIVKFISVIGDDEDGKRLKNIYIKNGLDTTYINEAENHKTNVTYSVIVNGENQMYGNTKIRTMDCLNIDILDKQIIPEIEDCNAVVTHLEMPYAMFKRILDETKRRNIPILVDPNPLPNLWYLFEDENIRKIDFLTPNQEELEAILELSSLSYEDLIKTYKNIIYTRGKLGAEFFVNGKKQLIPSIEVECIDDTGAGDCFNGAFANFLVDDKLDLTKKVELSNIFAALKTTKIGAQNSPTVEEVKKFIFEKNNNCENLGYLEREEK